MRKIIVKNNEPVETGVLIGLPYKKNSSEYENAIDALTEFSVTNENSILVAEIDLNEMPADLKVKHK